MKSMAVRKYKRYEGVELSARMWPTRVIERAPRWCSVDLRDGNQALVDPMSLNEKLEMFRLLLAMGFKEIEVGFPSASATEYNFLRLLIEEDLIPDDVTIQVLTQAREGLIRKTFAALKGAKRAIAHLYNSTSELQRRVVFKKDKAGIVSLAVEGATMMRREAERFEGGEILYEYSPESFTGTELDFSLDICEAVAGIWAPSPERPMIVNLPATVEMSTPNVYADRIEWFSTHISRRDSIILSVHPHNDRGTAVAAAELALMAGADRVEGTLFGNGERTGNVDIVTLALNMASQGIEPGLDVSDINAIIDTCERCTKIPVHIRHPYAGGLVYTAFSGSHQDAIHKGMKVYREEKPECWEVPYLPIDPSDVGRTYESIIRINSQSGKGGVAYVLEKEFGMILPKAMHPEFADMIQHLSDEGGKEVSAAAIGKVFEKEYLNAGGTLELIRCAVSDGPDGASVKAVIAAGGAKKTIRGEGNGPIDAFVAALLSLPSFGFELRVSDYHEHSLSQGSDSKAAAYIRLEGRDGQDWWGVGTDHNIHLASFKAIVSAVNRAVAALAAP
jgi:2-isopropylmalate synthase